MAGTDIGLPNLFPGFSLHDELALLVEAGLTLLHALQAATCNATEGMGLGGNVGTIEVGKLADLVLLERAELDELLHAATQADATPAASPVP